MKIIEAPATEICLTEFESTVSALDQLPTMPTIVQRLLTITASPDCSLDEIEELIAADQALVVNLMRLASSAAMSSRAATSLRAALVRIGLRNLRKLIIAALLIQTPSPGRLHTAVWKYSLRVAAIAEALNAKLAGEKVEDPFLCGLLHDFGIVALERVLGASYASAFNEPGTREHVEIERQQFAFDHCDMGAILAREWNLFPTLVSVMQLHHSPLAAKDIIDVASFRAVSLVSIARELCFDEMTEETGEVCALLGLSFDGVAEAAEKGIATFERVYAGLLT